MITPGEDIPSVTATSTGSAATGSSALETGSSKPRYADRGKQHLFLFADDFFLKEAMKQAL